MDFELTEEHKMIRDAARDFAQNELLNGFMKLPKTRKADVLNFFAKFM